MDEVDKDEDFGREEEEPADSVDSDHDKMMTTKTKEEKISRETNDDFMDMKSSSSAKNSLTDVESSPSDETGLLERYGSANIEVKSENKNKSY